MSLKDQETMKDLVADKSELNVFCFFPFSFRFRLNENETKDDNSLFGCLFTDSQTRTAYLQKYPRPVT